MQRVFMEKELIKERHRHRYEFNNNYKDVLVEKWFKSCRILIQKEILWKLLKLEDHPYYVGCQFHPNLLQDKPCTTFIPRFDFSST